MTCFWTRCKPGSNLYWQIGDMYTQNKNLSQMSRGSKKKKKKKKKWYSDLNMIGCWLIWKMIGCMVGKWHRLLIEQWLINELMKWLIKWLIELCLIETKFDQIKTRLFVDILNMVGLISMTVHNYKYC